MKRRALNSLLAAALFIAFCVWWLPPARATGPVIHVVNHSDLPDAAVADALPAFQQAVDLDFAPVWNAAGTLELGSGPGWTIELVDHTDMAGAAGYHEARHGAPYAQVGVHEGPNWQLVFTHELFETLADPYVDRAAYIAVFNPIAGWQTHAFYAIEVCDPVEYIHWAYNRRSASGLPVIISDFVTEAWYTGQGGGRLDFLGHVHHARHVLYGGYQYVFRDGQWFPTVNGVRAAIYRR